MVESQHDDGDDDDERQRRRVDVPRLLTLLVGPRLSGDVRPGEYRTRTQESIVTEPGVPAIGTLGKNPRFRWATVRVGRESQRPGRGGRRSAQTRRAAIAKESGEDCLSAAPDPAVGAPPMGGLRCLMQSFNPASSGVNEDVRIAPASRGQRTGRLEAQISRELDSEVRKDEYQSSRVKKLLLLGTGSVEAIDAASGDDDDVPSPQAIGEIDVV